MNVIGDLIVRIGADPKGLASGAAAAQGHMNQLGDAVHGATTRLLQFAAAAAGPAIMAKLIKSSLDSIDAQSKLAFRLNDSVVAIQGLEHAANLADVPVEKLTKSAGKLNAGLAEAARTAQGPVAEALRRLGLSAKDLLAVGTTERLALIADKIRDLGLTTAQQGEVLKNFGIRGQEMINLFEGGGKTIRDAVQQVKDFGGAISNVDAIRVEQANDAWTETFRLLKAVFDQLAVKMSPILQLVANQITETGVAMGGAGAIIESVVNFFIAGWVRAQKEVYDFRVAWDDNVAHFLNGLNGIIDGWNDFISNLTMEKIVEKLKKEWTTFTNDIKSSASSMWDTVVGIFESGGEQTKDPVEEMSNFVVPTISRIEHGYGKLRETLEKPPSFEDTKIAFKSLEDFYREQAEKTEKERERIRKSRGVEGDPLTEEKRKAMETQFLTFQQGLAKEDQALTIHRELQLKKLQEFEDKKIGTVEQRNAARTAIDEKFHKDQMDLIRSRLEEGILTEQEALARDLSKRLEMIGEFEKNRTITEETAGLLRKKHAEKAAMDLLLIQARQYSGLASIVDTAMGHISQVIGKEGGAAFNVMKAISMATALVKGYEAVLSAYAAGNAVGGPPLGAAFAAVAAAGVAAQIASIAATKPQGAGVEAGGGGGGGGGTIDAGSLGSSSGNAPKNGTLYIEGFDPNHLYSGKAAERLARTISEWEKDGGKAVMR